MYSELPYFFTQHLIITQFIILNFIMNVIFKFSLIMFANFLNLFFFSAYVYINGKLLKMIY